jgi:hypothetical protein
MQWLFSAVDKIGKTATRDSTDSIRVSLLL